MIATRTEQLPLIYQRFASEAQPYQSEAACARGCAYCCKDAGRIHITTLEGMVIKTAMGKLPVPQATKVRKALAKDMKRREQNQPSPCPFLLKNNACMIYQDRPFVCRRIYSLKRCSSSQPPVLSRAVMEMGEQTIRELQQLDDTGYSGHLSYILHMLEAPKFMATYQAGDFKPEEILDFGKSHQILINRVVSEK